MKKRLLLIPILIFVACETEDSSDLPTETAIYQDYLVRFSELDQATRLSATFREQNEDGVRLKLSGDARLEANSETVNYYSNAGNYFYRWERNDFIDLSIEFSKNSSRTFTNVVNVEDKSSLTIVNTDTIALSGGSLLTWTNPLLNNEHLDYRIQQGSQSGGSGYWKETGSTSLSIGDIITGSLGQGPANLIISRSIEINQLDQADGDPSNGRLIIEYETSYPIVLQ